jgi:hypothetical protein
LRSNLVFKARVRVSNPFLLCHLIRLSTRSFHRNGVAVPDTINRVLTTLAEQRGDLADCGRSEQILPGAKAPLSELELARLALSTLADAFVPATV